MAALKSPLHQVVEFEAGCRVNGVWVAFYIRMARLTATSSASRFWRQRRNVDLGERVLSRRI